MGLPLPPMPQTHLVPAQISDLTFAKARPTRPPHVLFYELYQRVAYFRCNGESAEFQASFEAAAALQPVFNGQKRC
jgi:hypothetical protein